MAKRILDSASAKQEANAELVESIDRLGSELRVFRDVVDEIRDSLSWITRNEVPMQLAGAVDSDSAKPKNVLSSEKANLTKHTQLIEDAIEGLSSAIRMATNEELQDCFNSLTTIKFKAELALDQARTKQSKRIT